jgi:hypothetical protein
MSDQKRSNMCLYADCCLKRRAKSNIAVVRNAQNVHNVRLCNVAELFQFSLHCKFLLHAEKISTRVSERKVS